MAPRVILGLGLVLGCVSALAAPVPKGPPRLRDRLVVDRGGDLRLVDPGTDREEPFPGVDPDRPPLAGSVHLSPDGGWVVWQPRPALVGLADERPIVRRWPAGGPGRPVRAAGECVGWFGNGAVLLREPGVVAKCARYDIDTGRTELVVLPTDITPVRPTADGTGVVGFKWVTDGGGRADWAVYDLAGRRTPLVDDDPPDLRTFSLRVSPDGRWVAFVRVDLQPRRARDGVYAMSLADRSPVRVGALKDEESCSGVCWSPAGDRVAYSWHRQPPGGKRVEAGGIVVVGRDGMAAKTVARPRETPAGFELLRVYDWR